MPGRRKPNRQCTLRRVGEQRPIGTIPPLGELASEGAVSSLSPFFTAMAVESPITSKNEQRTRAGSLSTRSGGERAQWCPRRYRSCRMRDGVRAPPREHAMIGVSGGGAAVGGLSRARRPVVSRSATILPGSPRESDNPAVRPDRACSDRAGRASRSVPTRPATDAGFPRYESIVELGESDHRSNRE